MESECKVFTACAKAKTVTHIIVLISQEATFGNQAEMLVQLDSDTRFQTDLETVYSITAIFHLSGSKTKSAIDKQTYDLVFIIRKTCVRSMANVFVEICSLYSWLN